MNHNAITFLIDGELWAQPVPLRMYLKTEIDLDIGDVRILPSSPADAIMDPGLLDYYNRELRFIREMGGEFAA